MSDSDFIVTGKAQRHYSPANICSSCRAPIGEFHSNNCGLIKKKIRKRLTVEYEVAVDANRDKHTIEFHDNESTWCLNNVIHELEDHVATHRCLCGNAEIKYVEDCSPPYLDE